MINVLLRRSFDQKVYLNMLNYHINVVYMCVCLSVFLVTGIE